MPPQTATTGNLEYATNLLIGEVRHTAEYNSPCIQLIERHQLGKGEYKKRFPKLGQASVSALTDGQDMVDSEDFGLTYIDAEPSEVGGKFVLTDKLSREETFDVFRQAGVLLGDAMGRKRDEDIIALFSSLDSAFGADNKNLSIQNAQACVSNMRELKAPSPIYVVHHPNAIGNLAQSAMAIGATYYAGLLDETTRKILSNFWRGIVINGVPFFDDGNISKISGSDSAYGAIFSKASMGLVEELMPRVERERDASLRATEINLVADYIAVEIDGAYGASMRYETGTLATTN